LFFVDKLFWDVEPPFSTFCNSIYNIDLLCLCPHGVETLSDDARLTYDDICLSHTSGLSREQRGLGRLKLAQW